MIDGREGDDRWQGGFVCWVALSPTKKTSLPSREGDDRWQGWR